uniref:Hexosyltransferase n=1 Tax=Neogobius melanostomus TaxID=47308 RepID=A0A8C6TPQ0_9GOBI
MFAVTTVPAALPLHPSSGWGLLRRSADSPLNRLLLNLIGKIATKTAAAEPSPPRPPPPREYQSPGPFFVEYPYKYNMVINEANRCEEEKPYLVLVVPVAPQNKVGRQLIRNSWGEPKVLSDKNVTLFFLLGLGKAVEKELLEESEQYGDIIQGDFVDCYKNLTIKTMVMLEWLDAYCRDATYAMKIDSDMFLNVPKLLEMLQHTPTTNCLTGLVERAAHTRRTCSEWAVPGLAPKAGGGGVPEKKVIYIEDVYLGMCMQRLGLQPTEPPDPGAFPLLGPKFDRCRYSTIIPTAYPENIDKMEMWRSFNTPGPSCENET